MKMKKPSITVMRQTCPLCNGVKAPQAKQCRPCAKKESMERLLEGKVEWEKLRADIIEYGKKNGIEIEPYR